MIVSYPLVNDQGEVNGAEVTLRFMDVHAIEHLTRWVRQPRTAVDIDAFRIDIDERYELVPGCICIYTNRDSFNVKADYDTIKTMMTELNEWGDR